MGLLTPDAAEVAMKLVPAVRAGDAVVRASSCLRGVRFDASM